MKEQILKVLTPIKEFWEAQEKKKKILILSVLGGVVVAAVIIVALLNYTEYETLYSGLDSAEAAEIYSQIENMGIEARLTTGGTISVPKDQSNMLYAELASMGYPKNSLDYTIFSDNVNMLSTDFEKREYARMQTQERLAAIIKRYDEVKDAAVTLTIPETKTTVITTSTKEPSASVSITLREGVRLSSTQISGITKLVQASVTGLKEENIVIVDGDLNFLTADGEENTDAENLAIERQKLQFKQQYQETFEQSILDLLVPGYGDGNVKVVVNADLNYDKQVSELTQYSPSHEDGSGMVQHEDHSNSSGATNGEGDVVGVEVNADDTYPTGDVGSQSVWSESSSSVSYLVTTLKQQTEKAGFYVDDLTVSVILYTDTGFLSDTTKLELTSAVARAVGVVEDRVSVTSLTGFGKDPVIQASTGYPFNWSRQIFFIVMASIMALIIVFLFLYINVSGKAKRKRRALEKYQMAVAKANHIAKEEKEAEEQAEVMSLLERERETREEAIKREIEEFTSQNPAMVAQLIKGWIHEEEED